jgi:ubiquinone biosynthesis protein
VQLRRREREQVRKKRGVTHYRYFGRYREIASVLVKYGFGDLLSTLNIENVLKLSSKLFGTKRRYIQKMPRWERVRLALEELGPTFIKLGQFASNRPDILPAELVAVLETLQDKVAPFSQKESCAIVEGELKKPLSELFAHFEPAPFASASMAQVHRAQLCDGTLVAVKVQRPRIAELINVDLEIMYTLARLIERHIYGAQYFNPVQLVDEFSGAIRKELDFNTEALHFDHFRRNFENNPSVHIPLVFHDFTSSKVLTTEFIDGIKVTNIDELTASGLDPKEIASIGVNVVLTQIFDHGFFHADPHPGNILIEPDNVLCFLDLGMVGILTPSSRGYLSSIIIGIVSRDPKRIVRTFSAISGQQIKRSDDLEYALTELIEEYASKSLGAINIGEMLSRLTHILITFRIKLIPGFYLLVKALVTMEGVGSKLDPDFNMLEHLEPFASKLVHEEFSPLRAAQTAFQTAHDFFYLLRDLPAESRDILQLIKSGKAHIEFEHRGLDPMLRKLDQVTNRLVFGVVLAALVVGSSIVVHADVRPHFNGISIIGLGGYIIAGFMAFMLLVSILRHEKM